MFFFDQIFFDQLFFRSKKVRFKKHFSSKNIFRQKCFGIFRRQKNPIGNFWLPIPIPNFPKIPKITLRKPCDKAKDTKNQKYTFLTLFSGFSMIFVYFYVALHVPLSMRISNPDSRPWIIWATRFFCPHVFRNTQTYTSPSPVLPADAIILICAISPSLGGIVTHQ